MLALTIGNKLFGLMNPFQAIATLRKFANYLAGIFPILAVLGDRIYSLLGWLCNLPLIKPLIESAGKSAFAVAVWKFFERFYWRDYAKDRMELGAAPAETIPVLRVMIQMCVVLSLVIPLAQIQNSPFKIDSLAIETFSGYKHSMPAWPVCLWIVCLPCAWACLLVGSAVCNRVVFACTAIGALYFLSTCVLYLPRSYLNGLLTLPILISLIYCESTLSSESRRAKFIRWICSCAVGAAAGFQFTILTPFRPWLATVLPFPGPVLSIGIGSVVGIFAAIICLSLASKLQASKVSIPIGKVVSVVSFMLIGFFIAATVRGGFAQIAGAIISTLDLSNGYLWPILYFVGVGIIHKLMGSSKVVAASVKGMLPSQVATPVLVIVLLLATGAVFSEDIINYLSFQTSAFGQQSFMLFLPFFKTCKTLIWRDPSLSMAADWMQWVLLLDIAVVGVLAFQKRLTPDAMTRLFFITCLTTLLLWEYIFQMSSFARSPSHSVLLIWLFAVWLLWLMHTIGWKLSLNSSPLWPSRGRLAIYGGVVSMLILQVNARAMCADYRIVNELFLTMFRGVIDVGLPYYLLLWANKRVKESTPSVGALLGVFSAGALASMCFNALDKCFTNAGFETTVKTQLQNLQTTGNLSLDVSVSVFWLFAKAVIFVFMLAAVKSFASRLSRKAQITNEAVSHHLMLYLIIAFASGVVSFSYTLVEIPLPTELRVAVAPLKQEVLFNCNVFHLYLAYWIAALTFGLGSIRFKAKQSRFFVFIVSLLGVGAILCGYELFEVTLRACGMLVRVLVVASGILIALLMWTLQELVSTDSSKAGLTEASLGSSTKSKPLSADALLTYGGTAKTALVAVFIFLAVSLLSPTFKSFSYQNVTAVAHPVLLAIDWKFKEELPAKEPYPEISVYIRESSGIRSTLQIMSLESDPNGVKPLMKKWIDFLHLQLSKLDSWDRLSPGAYSFQFTLPNQNGLSLFAVSTFVPRSNSRTEVFTLITDATHIEQATWELANLVKSLPTTSKRDGVLDNGAQ